MEEIKVDSTIDSVHYTLIEGDVTTHIDTMKVVTDQGDTTMIVKEHELQIVERLLNNPNYGGKIVSILILIFAVMAVAKRWKK